MSAHAAQRRFVQAASILRSNGYRDVARRMARRAYAATGAAALDFPLTPADVCSSDRVRWATPDRRPARPTPLTIGWILTPPSAGSGGHTTIFRMVEALESAGHHCILHLYDRHSTPARCHEGTIRTHWPTIAARVVDVGDGLHPCDAFIATSWETAHVLGSRGRTSPGSRLYFIQDYEPYFHARGTEYALAEDTYRFGFRNIALGRMVADLVGRCAATDSIGFSCDSGVYSLVNRGERRGIVFYSRPGSPRRGHSLAVLALRDFHRRRPEQPVHVFGTTGNDLPFPVTPHRHLPPPALAELYNHVLGGIGLSFTNISLTVEEMLACGTIPVVNDSPDARADMPSPMVEWAPPTPIGIADALCRIVDADGATARAVAASESIRRDNWRETRARLVDIVEGEVYGS